MLFFVAGVLSRSSLLGHLDTPSVFQIGVSNSQDAKVEKRRGRQGPGVRDCPGQSDGPLGLWASAFTQREPTQRARALSGSLPGPDYPALTL